jgi:hypothetical protein
VLGGRSTRCCVGINPRDSPVRCRGVREQHLNASEMHALAQLVGVRVYKPGAVFVREGDPIDESRYVAGPCVRDPCDGNAADVAVAVTRQGAHGAATRRSPRCSTPRTHAVPASASPHDV